MHDALNWLWQGCALAILTAVSLRLLRRARAAWRYRMCGSALLAVLALPLVGAMGEHAAAAAAAAERAPDPQPALVLPVAWWTAGAPLFALWIAWALFWSIRAVNGVRALRQARARALPFPAGVERQLPCWAVLRTDARRARLVVSPAVTAAAVIGAGRPIIAVAPRLLQRLTRAELDRVIAHEWAHVQRRDDIASLALIAVQVVAGWHPAVWWLQRQLTIEREGACDETAVAVTGSARAYAKCLTRIASMRSREPALTTGVLSASSLRGRVTRVLATDRLVSAAWSARAACVVVLVLCVASRVVAGFELVRPATPTPSEAHRADVLLPSARASGAPESPVSMRRESSRAHRDTAPPARATGREAVAWSGPSETALVRPGSTAPAAPRVLSSITPDVLSTTGLPRLPDPAIAQLSSTETASTEPASTTVAMNDGRRPEHSTAAPDAAPSPWSAAADAGVAIGRASEKAAVATSGFFSRVGKKIGSSF